MSHPVSLFPRGQAWGIIVACESPQTPPEREAPLAPSPLRSQQGPPPSTLLGFLHLGVRPGSAKVLWGGRWVPAVRGSGSSFGIISKCRFASNGLGFSHHSGPGWIPQRHRLSRKMGTFCFPLPWDPLHPEGMAASSRSTSFLCKRGPLQWAQVLAEATGNRCRPHQGIADLGLLLSP